MKNNSTNSSSFLGKVFKALLRLLNLDKKLAEASYKHLQLLEDKRTPIKKGYKKEVIGGAVCWWIGQEKRANGIFVYVPGGGFVMGPLKLHWKYCDIMSRQLNMAVLVIRYRLAPEYPFPAGLNDVFGAITTLQKKGLLQENWFLAGDSAGGNLVLGTCYQLAASVAALPRKIILKFPTVDMTTKENDAEILELSKEDIVLSPAFAEKVKAAYVGSHDLGDPLLSPVMGDLSVLPPVLLQHGTDDILVKGSREFVQKMQAAGKEIQYEEYEGMYHGFTLYAALPEAKRAIQSQVAFIKK